MSRSGRRVLVLGVALGLVAVGGGPPVHAQELPPVQELLDYLDDLYRASSAHSLMTMTVVRERGTRSLTLESWSIGEDEALIVIRNPAREAGTATLRNEDGLWNYAPRADRLIRIPTGLLSDAWMGSHFTNDDLVRETSYDDDYEAALAYDEEDGTRILRATMTPRPDAPVVYTRIDYVLTAGDWIPLRADYFDEGELVRTMRFDQVSRVGDRNLPMRMVLDPLDGSGEYTEVIYDMLELDVPVDEELFTRRGLRRVARGG